MRPTKGEISCTLAWPQATAWQNENSSVRLVWMPRSSSWRAASMPSQVEAILMSTRSMCTPSAWYSSIRRSARATVAEVLKDRRASTSVETRPGMVFRISQPKRTSMRSMTSSRLRPLYWATVARISGAYSGFCTALRMSEGLEKPEYAPLMRATVAQYKGRSHGGTHQRCVLGLLHRLEDERGIGGRIPWLELGQLVEVAGIGHHGRVLSKRIKLVHGTSFGREPGEGRHRTRAVRLYRQILRDRKSVV